MGRCHHRATRATFSALTAVIAAAILLYAAAAVATLALAGLVGFLLYAATRSILRRRRVTSKPDNPAIWRN